MVECVIRWRMEVEIVNIRPVAFIVIVQQADGTRTEKHDGADGLLFLWLLQLSSKSTLYPEARNPHRIRWQSRSRDEAIPSDGSQKNNPKRSSRIRKCLLFVCAKQKNNIWGSMMQNRNAKKKVLVARQQQLAGSEAGGQLGRFHFTWDGRWWWCTPAGVWHRIPLLRRRCIYFSLSAISPP